MTSVYIRVMPMLASAKSSNPRRRDPNNGDYTVKQFLMPGPARVVPYFHYNAGVCCIPAVRGTTP